MTISEIRQRRPKQRADVGQHTADVLQANETRPARDAVVRQFKKHQKTQPKIICENRASQLDRALVPANQTF